jgi:hypothetical protein
MEPLVSLRRPSRPAAAAAATTPSHAMARLAYVETFGCQMNVST